MKKIPFLTDWYNAQQASFINKMKAEGKCPDCRGRTHIVFMSSFEGHSIVCPSCKGSGMYSDWEETQRAE